MVRAALAPIVLLLVACAGREVPLATSTRRAGTAPASLDGPEGAPLVRGLLLRERAAWGGGPVRFVQLPDDGSPGDSIACRADAAGAFAVRLPPGRWKLVAGPGWPSDAVRVRLQDDGEEDPRPDEADGCVQASTVRLVPQGCSTWSCRDWFVDEDDRMWIDVLDPLPVIGRVVDEVTGQPVPGARLQVRDFAEEVGSPVVVDRAGGFRLGVPRWMKGDVAVVVRAAGRPDAAARVKLASSTPETIRMAATGVALEGVVIDLDEHPIEGARVTATLALADATGQDGIPVEVVREATTDARGRFRFGDLPRGSGWFRGGPTVAHVELLATAPGFSRGSEHAFAGAGQAPARLVLARAGTRFELQVLDHDGQPLPSARVRLHGQPDSSLAGGPDGRFVVEGLDELVHFTVSAPGHAPRALVARAPGPFVVRLGLAPPPILGRIVGAGHRVTASVPILWRVPEPTPRPGEVVERRPSLMPLHVEEGPDATFVVDEVPLFEAGEVPLVDLVEVRAVGCEPVRAAPGAVVELRGADVVGEGTVTARVVSLPTGERVEATCDGRAFFGHVRLRPGKHRLWFAAPSHAAVCRDVEVADRQLVELGDVALPLAGSVEVRFRNWPETPLGFAHANWRDEGGEHEDCTLPPAFADATWTVGGIAVGRTSLTFDVTTRGWRDTRHVAPAVEVDVRAGETTKLEVDLSRLTPPLR